MYSDMMFSFSLFANRKCFLWRRLTIISSQHPSLPILTSITSTIIPRILIFFIFISSILYLCIAYRMSSNLKTLLDECNQSHIYEQTGLFEDPENPIHSQVICAPNWAMQNFLTCCNS